MSNNDGTSSSRTLESSRSNPQPTETNVSDIRPTNIQREPTNTAREDDTVAVRLSRACSPISDERQRLVQQMESIVGEFRNGNIKRSQAFSRVFGVLEECTDVEDEQKEKMFDSYISEINSIQTIAHQSSQRIQTSPLAEVNQTKGNATSTKRSGDPPSKGVDDILERYCQKFNGDGSDLSDDDDDSRPSKRLRLRESDMPWYNKESSVTTLHPSCLESCCLLKKYHSDIPGAKFLVKIAPGCPEGIASPQWERILKGESIDLNAILSSLHCTSVDEERKGRFGDKEISLTVSESKRNIRTSAEWASAWRRAAKAVSFLFPHRAEELQEYGDYIDGEFVAKNLSSHNKIILYDIAIHNIVSGGQRLLLTNTHKFTHLYSAIVLPDGIEGGRNPVSRNSAPNAWPGGSKPEICQRFNSTNGCRLPDGECRYRHICQNCRKAGHSKDGCDADKK